MDKHSLPKQIDSCSSLFLRMKAFEFISRTYQKYFTRHVSGLNLGINLSTIFVMTLLLCQCQPVDQPATETNHSGKELVETYCQSCHLSVAPEQLPKVVWEREVLPKMAARMGLNIGPMAFTEQLKQQHLFLEYSQLSLEEWAQIQGYLLGQAPILLPVSNENSQIVEITDFDTFIPDLPEVNPLTTLLHVDEAQRGILFGNHSTESLHFLESETGKQSIFSTGGVPVDFLYMDDKLFVLNMGQVMPHNDSMGNLVSMNVLDRQLKVDQTIIPGLKRPVHMNINDLNGDGNEDLVVCNFGNLNGSLEWYDNFTSGNPEKHVLRNLPGAIKTSIVDANDDGRSDIIALMAQGDEGFFLYLNEGNGAFAEQRLLRFPPSHGSTYFELTDWNDDGYPDILYVNGDNGDYFPVVKGYHGIRIFLNDGHYQFSEELFLPLPGAFKAIIEDYDQDGDNDIAAISYFPDYNQEVIQDFVLFRNDGSDSFTREVLGESNQGKWLTMDAGDMDGDGDVDIVLGSAIFMQVEVPREIQLKWRQSAPPLVILKNLKN